MGLRANWPRVRWPVRPAQGSPGGAAVGVGEERTGAGERLRLPGASRLAVEEAHRLTRAPLCGLPPTP